MKARIGIMPEALIRKRLLAMAKGIYKPQANEPKVWYTSLGAISSLLCEDNIALLRLIDREKPRSLTHLAELTGRAKPNLSKTLHKLADKGFARLEQMSGKVIKPVTLFTDFEIHIAGDIEQRVIKATQGKIAA